MEVTKIKGINEKREEDLKKIGVTDTADLIRYFPRAYLDLRSKQMLKNAYHNYIVLTTGRILNIPVNRFAMRSGGFVKAVCEQEGYIYTVIWFNQPYVLNKLVTGEEYLFYGRVNERNGELSLVNPSFELCEKAFRLKGIVPQYAVKGNLTQKVMRDSIKLAVDIEKPKSIIPFDLKHKYELSGLYEAYRQVHNPTDFNLLKKSENRIAVEEYFSLISAFKFIKGDRNQVRINKYDCSDKDLLRFISERFPFEFTDGQKKAVNEIFADMKGSSVMNRLMQGDVGSGKTAVGMCAVYIAVKSGYQAVMLAPTEVLARQNYLAAKKAFPDYNVDLITGSLSAKEKRAVKGAAKLGITNI